MSLSVEVTVAGARGDPCPVGLDDVAGLLHRPQHRAGEGLAQREQAELERRDDRRSAAPTPQRPEQVGVVLGIDMTLGAVGGHDVEQRTCRRETLATGQPTDPATERVPSHADAARHPVQAHEAVLGGRPDHLAPPSPGLNTCGAGPWVDRHPAQPRRPQQDRAGQVAKGRSAVTGGLRGHPQAVGRREPDSRGDVAQLAGQHDEGRVLVGGEIPGLPCLVPTVVGRGHDIVGDGTPQRLEVYRPTPRQI